MEQHNAHRGWIAARFVSAVVCAWCCFPCSQGLDLSFLTTFAGPSGKSSERIGSAPHSNGPQLDDKVLQDPEIQVCVCVCVRV